MNSTVDGIEATNRAPSDCSDSRSIRPILCRKCKEHGVKAFMKGHGSKCPFNDCACDRVSKNPDCNRIASYCKCASVMSKRVSAILRRYRHAVTDCGLVLKPVRYSNGNTRLRVFPKYVNASQDCIQIPISSEEPRKNGQREEGHQLHATNRTGACKVSQIRPVQDQHSTEKCESHTTSSITTTQSNTHHQHITASFPPSSQFQCSKGLEELQPLMHPVCSTVMAPSIESNLHFPAVPQQPIPAEVIAENSTTVRWLIEHGRSPLIIGERITCNLLLSLDADRSHPMFWQFVHLVQKLEESMLT